MPTATQCRCGHSGDAHEHPWPGDDCRVCRCSGFTTVDVRDRAPIAVLTPALLDALGRR